MWMHGPHIRDRKAPVGACDRCGFLYNLSDLREQKQWAGLSVVSTGLLVCPRDLDELQQNGRRTINVGGDPAPLKNPRPPRYPTQAPQSLQFVLDDPAAGVLGVDYVSDDTTPTYGSTVQFNADFDAEFMI